MRIDVFTIFPELVDGFCRESLLGRARRPGGSTCAVTTCATTPPTSTAPSTTPRSAAAPGWCCGPSRSSPASRPPTRPARSTCSARAAGASTRRWPATLAGGDGFCLLCGRYEGVDHRVREHLVDGELSIGDYVLAGGEVAACVVIEAVTRLLPGVMGNERSADDGVLRRRRPELLE